MNRDMLSRRLIRRGFEVSVAEDGQKGVEMAGREAPDIILHGYEPACSGRLGGSAPVEGQPGATQSIPLIALTAHAMAGDRDRAMQAGCDDYDTKPIEFPRLMEKIDRLLTAKMKS